MKLIRKLKMWTRRVAGFFVPVRVNDNYVSNIRPKLKFTNKIRRDFGKWIPIGSDAPFGRLVYLKGRTKCGTPIVKFGKLSDMDKDGLTHWQDA